MTFKQLFSQSIFVKNVFILFTGSAVAQVIPIVISPILTRFYTPQDFGILAIYASLSSLIAVVATARYEYAIVLPQKDEDAASLFSLSVIIAFVVSFITFLLIYFLNDQIAVWYKEPALARWLYLAPVTVLFTGLYQSMNFWSTRNKLFKDISSCKIADSVSGTLTKIGFGIISSGAGGLIIGNITGQAFAIAMLLKNTKGIQFVKKIRNSFHEMIIQGKLHSDFLKYNSLHAFSDLLQSAFVIFMISCYFESAIVGLFGFTIRILKTPLGFIGSAVSQVFFQKASDMYSRGEELLPFVKKIIITLCKVAAPVFLGIMFFGADVFAFIFGEEWRRAGVYAAVLSPWLLLNFILSPLSVLPIIAKKQKQFFIYNLCGLSASIIVIAYGCFTACDFTSILYFYSGTLTIYCLLILYWLIQISCKKQKNHLP